MLRFYEQKGLLPRTARSTSNYRDYSPTAIERLAFIRGAQRVGFTLAEVHAPLDLRNTPLGCGEPPADRRGERYKSLERDGVRRVARSSDTS